jgi:hypothetical protein
MIISLNLVACCSLLILIYVVSTDVIILFKHVYSSHLGGFYRIDLLMFKRWTISIKLDLLGSLALSSVKFDPLMDQSSMNNLISDVYLRSYQGV